MINISAMERNQSVINNWRSSHSFPLNTFRINLREKTIQVDKRGLVAQRIKRLPAIAHKLRRMPHLRLSKMQDIGGCRAVVGTVPKVRALHKALVRSRMRHQLDHENDYISAPRQTGYRGLHLIYRYHSDRTELYDGLKIELQLRTELQHAWATAVEVVGYFRREMLKSDLGDEAWRRFFALMGMAMSNREKCAPVPNTPTSSAELAEELRDCAHKLDVVRHLTTYRAALNVSKHPGLAGKHYFILRLDPIGSVLEVTGYKKSQLEQASADYQSAEPTTFDQQAADVVLVSVDKVNGLQRAFPNYFFDTHLFLSELKRAIS